MKKILAISGGVDSVVLLDMFKDDPDVVVAHFNHGTRISADADEEFVKNLAKKHQKPFYVGHADLGADVSEEEARISRYEYFDNLTKALNGEIYTAHHADDLIESVAINLIRGTGWRGLTPFGNAKIRRPFLERETPLFRSDIYKYASENRLSFRLDPTNYEDKYLRNRVREKLINYPVQKKLQIIELYHRTNILRTEIDETTDDILSKICENTKNIETAKTTRITKTAKTTETYPRSLFQTLDPAVSLELLRQILKRSGISATKPQLTDFLRAIKTYAPGKYFNLPKDRMVKLDKTTFHVA